MKKILVLLVLFTALHGSEKLDQPLARFRVQHAPVAASLQTLARSAQLTLLVDAEVTGDVTVELEQTTVRAALEALTVPQGLYYEETPHYVVVRRFKTVLYTIDYPQLTRRGSGNSSVTLGGSNGAGQAIVDARFLTGSLTVRRTSPLARIRGRQIPAPVRRIPTPPRFPFLRKIKIRFGAPLKANCARC